MRQRMRWGRIGLCSLAGLLIVGWPGNRSVVHADPPADRGRPADPGNGNEHGNSGGGNGQLDSPDTGGFGDMGRHAGGGPGERPEQQSDTVGTRGGGGNSGGGNGQLTSPDTGGFGNMGRGGGGPGSDRGGSGDMGLHGANPDRTSRTERVTQIEGSSAANDPDRLHAHQDRARNEVPEDSVAAREDRRDNGERRHGPEERGRDRTRDQLDSLTRGLAALEHARWSYHPHDPRPQGNAGNVTMQDPFGFDRDSDREGRDRGRPIREVEAPEPSPEPVPQPPQEPEPATAPTPTLNLAEVVSVDVTDPFLGYIQEALQWWSNLSIDPSNPYYSWLSSYAAYAIAYWEQRLADYLASPPDTYQAVLVNGDLVDYSLTLQPVEGMEGSTLVVTTQLVSTETTTLTGYTGDWEAVTVTYETGQVLMEQTQELSLSSDTSTFTFSLDPSTALMDGGFFNGWEGVTADIVVTVTDPASGASYTITYDKQLLLVDPYGIVYDKTTGLPIANATVTVHHVDGSVVTLDKAGNANVSNPQTTDATGRYNCRLPVGRKYYLSVVAPGYAPYKSGLFSERGTIVREDVAMMPSGAVTQAPPTEPEAVLTMPGDTLLAIPTELPQISEPGVLR